MSRPKHHISVVVPVYNEVAGIATFHNELLSPVLEKARKYSFSVVYVDDGSNDASLEKLHKLSGSDPGVVVVSLSRNFGKEIAVTAGIENAIGDAVIVLDADGQHPPAIIPEFIAKWRGGAQVVVGVRSGNQGEGFVKKFGSKLFYKLINSIADVNLIPGSTDFRLIDREVRDEFVNITERNRITRGLIDWMGYQKAYIEFESPERLAGEASYGIKKLVGLAINSFVSLSLKPLFVFGWFGLFITAFSAIVGVFIIIEQLIMNDPLALHITGSAMLGVFVTFMVGIVLMSQAMIALYMSHIYNEARNRPLFIINKKQSKNL